SPPAPRAGAPPARHRGARRAGGGRDGLAEHGRADALLRPPRGARPVPVCLLLLGGRRTRSRTPARARVMGARSISRGRDHGGLRFGFCRGAVLVTRKATIAGADTRLGMDRGAIRELAAALRVPPTQQARPGSLARSHGAVTAKSWSRAW